MRVILLLTALLLARAAFADSAEDAIKAIDQGLALLKAGDLPAARAAFQRAHDLVPDKANPYRLLGIVDARLGDCARAVEELDTFLKRVQADDPRAIESITVRDRCKEELQPKLGALVIESIPSGAEVRLDQKDKPPEGTTPWRNESIPAGNHVVFLSKPGYQASVSIVQVARGGVSNVQVVLPAEPPPNVVERPATSPTQLVAQAPPPPKKKWKLWVGIGVPVGVVLGVGAFLLGCYETKCLGSGNGGNNNRDHSATLLPPLVMGGN